MRSACTWLIGAVLVSALAGCQEQPQGGVGPPATVASTTTSWRLLGLDQGGADQSGQPAATHAFVVDLDGPAGFARVTLATEPTGAGSDPASPTLNDVLFPVSGPTHLVATRGPEPDRARLLLTTNGAESSVILHTVPLAATEDEVESLVLNQPGAMITEGQEVSLGRWTAHHDGKTTTQTLRLLLTRHATGPRLKPERREAVR